MATQPMIDFGQLALQPKPQTIDGAQIRRGNTPPLAPLRKPEAFVEIIPPPQVDFVRGIGRQYAFYHFHGQQCPEREFIESLIMSEFVDDGSPLPYYPELRGGRNPINVIDSKS